MLKFLARRIGHPVRLLLVLCLALTLTGCVVPDALTVKAPVNAPVKAPVSGPSSTPRSLINPHLAAALAHAPAATDYLAFTNWEVIKEVAGVTDLTSASSMDERLDFVLPLTLKEQALASFYGNSRFLKHAETWGWDATDLLWEANLTTDGPPVYLLRFRDDFDFAPVIARLEERGYSTSAVGEATLYSHALDLKLDWLAMSELTVLNIAHLADERLFIMSSGPDAVRATLDAIAQGMTLATLPAINSVASALGDAGAVLLSPTGCQLIDVMPGGDVAPAVREALIGELDRAGIRGLYDLFGFGYRMQAVNGKSLPLGLFVHHYPLAEQAAADLEPRRLVAETANSLVVNQPYAELFEVIDATVTNDSTGGANLILSLHALTRPPQLFINMFYQRDLLFSACGIAEE